MNQKSYILAGLLLASGATMAQLPKRPIEVGLKGGVTFVHGFTTIPAQPTSIVGVQVPQIDNKNNGIGTGYSAGAFVQFNKYNRKGYVQIELTYNRYLLKQKTNLTLDVNANPALAARLAVSFAPGLLNATVDVTSESVIESYDVPVLFGRRVLHDKVRVFIGPTLLFVNKSVATRSTKGQINPNTAIGFDNGFGKGIPIPATAETTNLLSPREAINLQVKRVTWALEAGVGISPLPLLDIDLRYAVPAGGVYKDTNIKGYLGIATLTAGLRIP